MSAHDDALNDFLDALVAGPLPDVLGVDVGRSAPAPGPGRRPAGATDPPGGGHVPAQGRPQFLGVLGVQVDLVIGAVQPELNASLGFAPIEIVDEEGLYFLRHCALQFWRSVTGSGDHGHGSGPRQRPPVSHLSDTSDTSGIDAGPLP